MFKLQDGREHFWQWDSDRKLIVEDASISEVHFCNRTDECSLVCETYVEDGITLVNVPNILLQNAWRIHVYAFDGYYTKHEDCYEVIARTKPADYAYTETEVLNWETINTKVEAALEKTGYYVPTVDSNGNLSWEGSTETLPEVKTVNIKGVKGDTGAAFTYDMFTEEQLASLKGEKGDKGETGETGESGYTPVRGTDYWTEADQTAILADLDNKIANKADKLKTIPHTDISDYPIKLTDQLADESFLNCKVWGNTEGIGDLDSTSGKYKIPIVTHGKNVFDITKCFNYKAEKGGIYLSANANRDNKQGEVNKLTNMQAGRTYVITATSTSPSGYFVYLNGSQKVWKWGQSYTPTQADIDGWIYFYKHTETTAPEGVTDVTITNVQIEEATTATNYESYITPIQATITLDTQLMLGEYVDLLEKKRYSSTGAASDVVITGELKTVDSDTNYIECAATVKPEKIEVAYYQDINKVIAEMKTAILAQGGNV